LLIVFKIAFQSEEMIDHDLSICSPYLLELIDRIDFKHGVLTGVVTEAKIVEVTVNDQ
jgi:hypothetical protein